MILGGGVVTDVWLRADQLRLLASAAAYDLDRGEERTRSTAELVALFHRLQTVTPPVAVAEVGAFDAAFSRALKAAHPTARVVAFEGNPQNAAHCRALHDYGALGVDYLNCLVCDRVGTAEMMIQEDRVVADGNGLKRNDSLLRRTKPGVTYAPQTLPTTTLDAVFARELEGDGGFALWIDVEGAAEAVLRGASAVLARTHTLLIEVEEHPYWEGQWLFDDVHRRLTELGFVAVARDYEYEHQFNVVYVAASLWAQPAAKWMLVQHASRIARPPRS